MNILMAASEFAPLVGLGNLADEVAELAGELRAQGHEVSVVVPFYRSIRESKEFKTKKTGVKFSVPVGAGRYPCDILEYKAAKGVQVFLVARDEYFDRSGLYGVDGRDYQDNAARFIFFTKCAVELARRLEPQPSVLHLHSWQTALAPVFVRDQKLPFRTVLTPHSLEYQGNFWSYDFGLTNLPGDLFSPRGVEYFGSMNCLKGGILFADAVVLPGERAVAAAQTPESGCGLDPVLREQQHKLHGILSSEGLAGWKPEDDKRLTAPFSAAKPAGRGKNRATFLTAAGLDLGEPRATFVCFTEASEGTGLDALFGALDRLMVEDVRVAVLGPVPQENYIALEVARRKYRGRFFQTDAFDETLARKALAAADFLLVPGRSEPSLRWIRRGLLYGAVPIAAQCGGLFQLVREWEPGKNLGDGFVFYAPTADGLLDACRRAMRVMDDAAERDVLRRRALSHDFTPAKAATEHAALYERLVNPTGAARAA